jgi:O-antigen/teichoic acid export membrane protein
MRSTMLAMLIYGFSCLIPLALLQRFSPLPILFDWKLINKKTAIEIGKFSLPIMISHASYMVYMTIAVIFLEQYTSAAIVGIYSLALTLGVMFSFLPTGLATFLMPKISGAPGLQHGKMLLSALGLAMLINIVLLAAYYFLVPMLIGKLFSPDYLVIPEVFVTTGMVMTLMGIHTIVSAVFVGSGRAQDETKSRLVTVMLTALSCWWLIPRFGIMGAVSANLIGIIGGLGIYALIFLLDRFKINREIN